MSAGLSCRAGRSCCWDTPTGRGTCWSTRAISMSPRATPVGRRTGGGADPAAHGGNRDDSPKTKTSAASASRSPTPDDSRSTTIRMVRASDSYVEINALAELRLGRVAIYANALNLTNVRQQDTSPLLRPAPGLGGDPITDAWGPLVGRTLQRRSPSQDVVVTPSGLRSGGSMKTMKWMQAAAAVLFGMLAAASVHAQGTSAPAPRAATK